MKIKDFLEGNNSKAIAKEIESKIVDAARNVKIGIRSILEAKDKKVVVIYYNYGEEAFQGQMTDKNAIFRKLDPIVSKILTDEGYDIKQSLRSGYDKNVASIFYFMNEPKDSE